MVTLLRPRIEGSDLVYDIELVSGDLPDEDGPAAVFIDIIGRPLTPVSVAGDTRRCARRTRRWR